MRYCLACGKEWGPGYDRCCVEGALVNVRAEGIFKKSTRYFTLDGQVLDVQELEEMKRAAQARLAAQLEEKPRAEKVRLAARAAEDARIAAARAVEQKQLEEKRRAEKARLAARAAEDARVAAARAVGQQQYEVHVKSMLTAGRIVADAKAVPILVVALGDQDAQVRNTAEATLRTFKDQDAVDALCEIFAKQQPYWEKVAANPTLMEIARERGWMNEKSRYIRRRSGDPYVSRILERIDSYGSSLESLLEAAQRLRSERVLTASYFDDLGERLSRARETTRFDVWLKSNQDGKPSCYDHPSGETIYSRTVEDGEFLCKECGRQVILTHYLSEGDSHYRHKAVVELGELVNTLGGLDAMASVGKRYLARMGNLGPFFGDLSRCWNGIGQWRD